MSALLNISCLSFYQTYSVLALGSKKSDSTYIKKVRAACFSNAFSWVGGTKISKVRAAKLRVLVGVDPEANTVKNLDNLCILTREEVYQWLDELSVLFSENSLSYRILEKKVGGIGFIEVVVKVYDLPTYYIKWILTYIRLLSESPCNWVLKEVFTLKQKVEEFKELPLLSVFMFIWSFMGGWHAFSASRENRCFIPRSFEYLKKALKVSHQGNTSVEEWFIKNFEKVSYSLSDISWISCAKDIRMRFRDPNIVNQEILKECINEDALNRYLKFLELIKQTKETK